jgi:isochorismate synthase
MIGKDRKMAVQAKQTGSEMQMGVYTIGAIFGAATAAGAAIAVWQRPGMAQPQAVIDLSATPALAPVDFAARQPVFVFAPFVSAPAGAALQLHADLWFDGAALHRYTLNGSPDRARRAARFFAAFDAPPPAQPPLWYAAESTRSHAAAEGEFTALVRGAIDFIRTTGIAKVVVSRTAALPLPVGFDPAAAFALLCARYPHAFVSLVAIPGIGTWLGATPEVLLTLDDAGLTTMALAGTQRRPNDQPLESVRWGRKETVEQEMVGAYIRGFFASAGAANVQETGPQTVAAGSVVHLQTLFRVDLPEAERLILANRVLNELHPTSAVCGMPKHQALAFILAHEGYDRSFYSGFLGPVHIQGASSLYVNLRCMQLDAAAAHLYAGAGITADSDPAAEWRETALKAETMLAVLTPEAV